MNITIVAKTLYGSFKEQRCIGALAENGTSLRLLSKSGSRFHPSDTPYQIGDIWEMEYNASENISPPHLEDVLVIKAEKIGTQSNLKAYIKSKINPWSGFIKDTFEGKLKCTRNGSWYIPFDGILPSCSTGFWISGFDSEKIENDNKIRYLFKGSHGWTYSIPFVGELSSYLQLDKIESGTLIRVSLSGLWPLSHFPRGYWLQISGWYL